MKHHLLIILLLFMAASAESSVAGKSFSIIFIIHGDADYLYHDTAGTSYYADKEVLDQAFDAAKNIDNAEVFIFHQGPSSKFLFFRQDDSHFYYFRNGKRVKEDSYLREEEDSTFSVELKLYEKYRDEDQDSPIKMLLYYGHEIPEKHSINPYNTTHARIPFNSELFQKAVQGFTTKSKFDLIVLSTCNNGTPDMIRRLSPYTKYIIASPENLHLSQMNSSALKNLNVQNYKPDVFARAFAENSFNQLKKNTLTVITISVYDVNKTKKYVNEVTDNQKGQSHSSGKASVINCDCSTLEAYRRPGIESGVTVFYNPPAFGKNKNKPKHSGWGCKSENVN